MERCSSGQGGDGRSGSKERRMVVGRDIGRAVGRIRGPDDAPGLRRPPPGGGARTVAGCAGRVPAGDPAPGGRPWYRPDGWRGPRSEAGAGGARPPEPDDRHRTRRPGLRRARPPHPRLLPGVLRGRHGSLAGPQRGGERVRPGVRPESGDPVRPHPGKPVPGCGGRSQVPARAGVLRRRSRTRRSGPWSSVRSTSGAATSARSTGGGARQRSVSSPPRPGSSSAALPWAGSAPRTRTPAESRRMDHHTGMSDRGHGGNGPLPFAADGGRFLTAAAAMAAPDPRSLRRRYGTAAG